MKSLNRMEINYLILDQSSGKLGFKKPRTCFFTYVKGGLIPIHKKTGTGPVLSKKSN